VDTCEGKFNFPDKHCVFSYHILSLPMKKASIKNELMEGHHSFYAHLNSYVYINYAPKFFPVKNRHIEQLDKFSLDMHKRSASSRDIVLSRHTSSEGFTSFLVKLIK
jgi:hypothetical protein